MDIPTYGSQAGIGALQQTTEAQVWSMRESDLQRSPEVIKSTAADSGNTPTTTLRPGLILAKKTSDGLLYAYNPDASDGTEIAYAVLAEGISMLGAGGSAEDKNCHVIVGGWLKTAALVTGQDGGYDAQARRQLTATGRFFFDDDFASSAARISRHKTVVPKAADYTVVAADNGILFVATAAVNFTLPTIAAGLGFQFLQSANSNLVITAPVADTIIFDDTAGGLSTSLTFSTANKKMGAHLRVYSVYTATSTLLWAVELLSTHTVTAA